MIQAVIFDCFGVLTDDGWLPFKREHFSHDPDLEQQATDLNKRVDAGLSDYGQSVTDIAELADVPREQARQAIEDHVPNEELFGYISTRLKPDYRIGMLSNAGANWLHDMFSPDQVALFDATALSYETGAVKPDSRAYQIICDRLQVDAQGCVFIDDQEKYCAAARDSGMQAVHYTGFEQLKRDLEPLLSQGRR